MTEYHYVVARPFTYGKKRLKPGDIWEPTGGRFDKAIADSFMVILQQVEQAPETPKTTSRRPAAKRKAA